MKGGSPVDGQVTHEIGPDVFLITSFDMFGWIWAETLLPAIHQQT